MKMLLSYEKIVFGHGTVKETLRPLGVIVWEIYTLSTLYVRHGVCSLVRQRLFLQQYISTLSPLCFKIIYVTKNKDNNCSPGDKGKENKKIITKSN